jgi:hypothetical protein
VVKQLLVCILALFATGCTATILKCPTFQEQLTQFEKTTDTDVRQAVEGFVQEAIEKTKEPKIKMWQLFLTGKEDAVIVYFLLETKEEEKGTLYKVERLVILAVVKAENKWIVIKAQTSLVGAEKLGRTAAQMLE